MKRPKLDNLRLAVEARTLRERVILLAAVVGALFYLWLEIGVDALNVREQALARQVTRLDGQIAEQQIRRAEVEESYSRDPNAFMRNRLNSLREDSMAVDSRLNELYGQLVLPREMSRMLTTILQRETTLRLVNLENATPESLLSTDVDAAPLQGALGEEALAEGEALEVFKHGLTMVFEGGYLDTIRFMRSIEELESKFFWQDLVYEVSDYPTARITLSIFTLSTREEWIGV